MIKCRVTSDEIPPVEDVLEDLVDGVAEVDAAVGVGRTVVQHKLPLEICVMSLPLVEGPERLRSNHLSVSVYPGLAFQS